MQPMSFQHYLKQVGRGKNGARHLSREQAAELLDLILSGRASDLQIGAFCLAMRMKGETPHELAGFLDAARRHVQPVPVSARPTIVLPSYHGARRLPVLTPLLALRLVAEGFRVILHGIPRDPDRVTSADVLAELGVTPLFDVAEIRDDRLNLVPTHVLSPPLRRLLEVRRVVGVRNVGHSLIKLLNPCQERALVLGSYPHPEFQQAMLEAARLTQADAMILRGIEGEAVADARRLQTIDVVIGGRVERYQEVQGGTLATLPDWPAEISAPAIAHYTDSVLQGQSRLPHPLACQLAAIRRAMVALRRDHAPAAGAAPEGPARGSAPAMPELSPATHES